MTERSTSNVMLKVEEKVRVSELLSIYGALLSEKQAEILRMYYDEDLGFSEIAQQLGVTRQAVYDATRQGKAALENYERHLRLLEGQTASADGAKGASQTALTQQDGAEPQIREIIARIERIASEDIIYDTTRLRRYVAELKKALWEGSQWGQ